MVCSSYEGVESNAASRNPLLVVEAILAETKLG